MGSRCLFITGSVPALSGTGASIRAGLTLEALAQAFSVVLVIATRRSQNALPDLSPEMQCLCEEVQFFQQTDFGISGTESWLEPALLKGWDEQEMNMSFMTLHGQCFDAVHVFRLHLMPVWRHLRDTLSVSAGRVILDLDDIESRAHFREIRLKGLALGRLGILKELVEGFKLRQAENHVASEVSSILVCSEGDKNALSRRIGQSKLSVLPNGARFPKPFPRRIGDGSIVLLFVGSLFYGPNQHALRWLITKILPEIRTGSARPIRLVIVGKRPPAWLKELAAQNGAELHADVPSVAPFYKDSDIVVVPILSGGGTRIKIIEAFGYGRPVVSTRIGAEGLAVCDEQELLLAETPIAFCQALAKLSGSDDYYERITLNARKLVDAKYSRDAFVQALQYIHARTDTDPDNDAKLDQESAHT